MEISELKKVTDEMICNFVNELGLDGNFYISSSNCPIVYGNLGKYSAVRQGTLLGRFFTAKNNDLKIFLKKSNFTQDEMKKYYSNGLVVINDYFQDKSPSKELLVTCIHERFHSNRMILANTPYSGDEDIPNYFYTDGRFVRNNDVGRNEYVDPAQEILLGSIDQSRDVVSYYKNLSFEEKDDLQFENNIVSDKNLFQKIIDETLIDLMAYISYELSTNNFSNIMEVVDYISKHSKNERFRGMTNIILRHNDLDLFKWMIDPLSYQIDDIHYDYFLNYINHDDIDSIKKIMNYENLEIDDDIINLFSGNSLSKSK